MDDALHSFAADEIGNLTDEEMERYRQLVEYEIALDALFKRHQEAHRMFWIESGEQQCPECKRLK